jgi:mono/diheme cytochrome c family protein
MPSQFFLLVILASFALQDAISAESQLTFNKQIAPIIFKNCSECHRPGEAAPFPFLSYKDVAKKGKTIARVVASRQMPPWKPESGSYEFLHERKLKPEEISMIETWVQQGMPEGDPHQKPQPPKFASGWRLGEPDLILEMPAAYRIPAEGPDIYRNIAVPMGTTEDKWITAIDMKPTARAAVHHVLYFADANAKAHLKPPQGSEPGFNGMRPGGAAIALGGWAVGAQPQFFPHGLSLKVPKASDFVVQYHFHPTGKPEEEKSLIGLYFAKEPPQRTLARIQMPPEYSIFSGLDIPPGEKDFVIRDTYNLPVGIDAVGVSAHAHYIATKMKMTATFPSGEVKTLLLINDWDFAWQDRYYFKDLVLLPAGTRLDAEIHWDNSAENPRNPSNPPIRVRWGEESKDEMGSISLIAVAHEEIDAKTLRESQTRRRNDLAREKMKADPELAMRIFKMLAE